MRMKKIAVIGSGIIGASLAYHLAYHLASAGADVMMLEAGAAGGLATPNSWAWINASWGNTPDYVALKLLAMAEWRSISRLHEDLTVNWCGGLLWDLADDELQQFVEARAEIGYDIRLVDSKRALQLEPRLKFSPSLAAHATAEGAIEPAIAARGLLKMARAHGANSAALLQMIGIDLNMGSPPGLLVYSKPTARLLNRLIMAPELHVRQTNEGRLVAGSDFAGTAPGTDPRAAAEILHDHRGDIVRPFHPDRLCTNIAPIFRT